MTLQEVGAWVNGFIRLCFAEKWLFLKVWVPVVTLTIVYVMGSTPEYAASTKILPYKSERSMLGGLSGLAGLAGINLPTGGNQVLTSDLYPEVVGTFTFRSELAATPLRFTDGTRTYQHHFEQVQRPSLMDKVEYWTIGIPYRLRQKLRGPQPTQPQVFDSTMVRHTELYLDLIEGMGERISVYYDRKTTMLTITAKMPDPVAAAALAKATADQLMRVIIDFESRKASDQAEFLEQQQQKAEARYKSAQRAQALNQDRSRGTVYASDQLEQQRLASEFTLAFDLYRTITQQLEAARVKQQEDTPVLTVIEEAVIPNRAVFPRKTWSVMLMFVLSTVLTMGYLLVRGQSRATDL